jgi:6-phosphofructokinase
MTNAIYLADYLIKQNCKTRVVVTPCSVDGGMNPKHIDAAVGFDTSSKVYS